MESRRSDKTKTYRPRHDRLTAATPEDLDGYAKPQRDIIWSVAFAAAGKLQVLARASPARLNRLSNTLMLGLEFEVNGRSGRFGVGTKKIAAIGEIECLLNWLRKWLSCVCWWRRSRLCKFCFCGRNCVGWYVMFDFFYDGAMIFHYDLFSWLHLWFIKRWPQINQLTFHIKWRVFDFRMQINLDLFKCKLYCQVYIIRCIFILKIDLNLDLCSSCD